MPRNGAFAVWRGFRTLPSGRGSGDARRRRSRRRPFCVTPSHPHSVFVPQPLAGERAAPRPQVRRLHAGSRGPVDDVRESGDSSFPRARGVKRALAPLSTGTAVVPRSVALAPRLSHGSVNGSFEAFFLSPLCLNLQSNAPFGWR